MPNYANGKVYKIWSPSHPGDIYIGSTCQPLSYRMSKHRYTYKKYKQDKSRYTTSCNILEYGDAKIELIEMVKCSCKEELTAREGYYIRKLDCVNKIIAGRTQKEYYQDTKERARLWGIHYRNHNKEKITHQKKQWYQENKERLLKKMKNRYENNKEMILQKNKQRAKQQIKCDCGSLLIRGNLPRHRKSKKHIEYLESL